MNGITTIFGHKKWVFTYTILAIAVWRLEPAGLMQVISILTPAVLAANWLDKSKFNKE